MHTVNHSDLCSKPPRDLWIPAKNKAITSHKQPAFLHFPSVFFTPDEWTRPCSSRRPMSTQEMMDYWPIKCTIDGGCVIFHRVQRKKISACILFELFLWSFFFLRVRRGLFVIGKLITRVMDDTYLWIFFIVIDAAFPYLVDNTYRPCFWVIISRAKGERCSLDCAMRSGEG